MTNEELMEAFGEYQKMRGFSPTTPRRRANTLRNLAKIVAPRGLLEASEEDCLELLMRYPCAATRCAYRSDMMAFYRWAVRRRLTVDDPARDIESIKKPRPLPRRVPPHELSAAVAAGTGTEQLILLLGALAGLRASEIAKLHTDDLNFEAERPILVVRGGKGLKDRVLPLHPELAARLRTIPTGWVFTNATGGHVNSQTITRRAAAAFRRVGSTAVMHMCRHYFGTSCAQIADGNIILVSQLMGHEHPETTMGYVKFNPSNGADVVNRIASHVEPDEMTKRRQLRAGGE